MLGNAVSTTFWTSVRSEPSFRHDPIKSVIALTLKAATAILPILLKDELKDDSSILEPESPSFFICPL